jgi:PhzF family phenazine biosynthesis protein
LATIGASVTAIERSPGKINRMKIPVFHVDAFTDHPFKGNPAAVCLLDSWLDDAGMHKVAAENNVSATAFMVPSNGGYALRWFTARSEIKLCGHATLASAYVVLNLLQPRLDCVQFSTQFRGELTVRPDGERLAMNFPATIAKTCAYPPEVIRALDPSVERSDVLEVLQANDTYLVVVNSRNLLQNLRPDFALLENLHPYAVSVTASGEDSDFVSRYFAPSYGIPEDPVTGSAHCMLAPYWAQRIGKPILHARQLSERGGELWCELAGDRVILKGKAVYVMKGTLTI